MRKQTNRRKLNGFSILEVVIGIFIFVVGMLALAALQGALTRSMADAKLRTTAVNLADRALERQRGFTHLGPGGVGVPFAYDDITTPGTDPTITLSGVTYTIDMNVTDYYYQLASDEFTTTQPSGVVYSNFKQVDVTVTWDAVQDFRAGEGEVVTSGDLNTGSVTLTSTIPAIITSASGRVSDASDGGELVHTVTYNPGSNPDVVALDLGGDKFKESLLPEPDVIRTDELVKTTFDVVTYSQSDGNTFLRREEFAAVSCECTLRTTAGSARRPVIWAGDEYAAGHFVEKPYGESAGNQNSSLCDSCCRDHHDGGSTGQTGDSGDLYANVVGPFKADDEYTDPGSPRESDHIHYQTDQVTPAADGDEYLEACRLVRVDGFWRVAQDFRREDQFIFPQDFLDGYNSNDGITYSNYVTSAAAEYTSDTGGNDVYPTSSTPCIGLSESCGSPSAVPTMQGDYSAALGSNELPSWTELVTEGTEEQQLRSRGVYIDYMSMDLRKFMAECFSGDTLTLDAKCCIKENGEKATSGCSADDLFIDKTISANLLEVIPFYEVQLTRLENWDQSVVTNPPITLTNQALADANTHSRGAIAQIDLGPTDVMTNSHRGNIGFTNTFPIDPVFETAGASLNVQSFDAGGGSAVDNGTPPIQVSGRFTAPDTGFPTIEVTGVGDVRCTLLSDGYRCDVDANAGTAKILITGYEDMSNPSKDRKWRYVCSDSLTRTSSHASAAESGNHWAEFQLLGVTMGAEYNISIILTDNATCS